MNHIKYWLFDIRLWILVLFLIRLENIDLPPLDEHSWRQTITLGVARNYLEWDADFFHPRTVICDSRGGIQAQEFPLFNYCIFLLWKIFGAHDWCYRLFNLIVASFGLFAFSKIVRRLTDEKTALYSTVVFGVSVAFMYARKGMPDVFAVSLTLMGIQWAWRYLDEKKQWQLLLFFLLTATGLLCKMPAACVLAFLAPLALNTQDDKKTRIELAGAGALALATMAAWYFVWVPWAEKEYGFPLFYPQGIAEGFQQLVAMRDDTLSRFYPIALTSKLAFVFFLAGLFWMFREKNRALTTIFATSTLLLFALMLKAGATFSGHVYYIIPYVPVMSLLAGYGLQQVIRSENLRIVLLIAIATEAVYFHKTDFFIPWQEKKFIKLESITDSVVPKDSRVLVNGKNGSPAMMYFTHRLGWTVDDRMKDSHWLDGENTVGLNYVIIDRSQWKDSIPYPMLYEDNEFRIFKIKKD
ncbi:MAG: glycosyltransferase family 39 protein [Saprospiraceae bacterium]|nr:glycosyltransferase family 39 protein [Saprospiraceae bacterium]